MGNLHRWLLLVLALSLLSWSAAPTAPVAAQEQAGSTVSGQVLLQGASQHGGVKVRLGARSVTSGADGSFTFADMPPGRFTITADAAGYLMSRVTDLEVGLSGQTSEVLDAGTMILLAGDVNGDGLVDDLDLELLSGQLGQAPPDNLVVDFTGDGQVDVRDLVLVSANRGAREVGGAVVDTGTITGVATSATDGSPLPEVAVTLQVDVDGDGSFSPLGQDVFAPGLEQMFAETRLDSTDRQGLFAFESVPVSIDGRSLKLLVELHQEGFGTFSQTLSFAGDSFLNFPLEPTARLEDQDLSDGAQLSLMIEPPTQEEPPVPEVQIDVPPEALPPEVSQVNAFVNLSDPRDNPEVVPGNFLASDPELGEVQLESTVYGYVELQDQDGTPIFTSDNPSPQPVKLRMKVPAGQYTTLRDITPENPGEVNVPLYSYDYEAATWRLADNPGRLEAEDGTVISQEQLADVWGGRFEGSVYVAGEVSHFSRWNVDYPVSTHASICGRIVDIHGSPIRDVEIHTSGVTFTSNFTKPRRSDHSGTFCDDSKVSDEEESEDEDEKTPPAVQVVKAGMSFTNEFRVRVRVRFQGDETLKVLRVRADLREQGESAPFATLQDQITVAEKGPLVIDFPFNLAEEGVPRFQSHTDVRAEAVAEETWPDDPPVTLRGTDDEEGRILLPVVVTHGILGDLATTSQGGYDTIGPYLPVMAASLGNDGYRETGPYITMQTLQYPSLHEQGISWLARNHLGPAVDRGLKFTYADKVDVVAHSMGGLLSRYYIENLGGSDKVRKLVMIGTPNEGAAKAHGQMEDNTQRLLVRAAKLAGWQIIQDFLHGVDPTTLGTLTLKQLLPDYPYYSEDQYGISGIVGPGYPTDDHMSLNEGASGELGPNTFLRNLNQNGFASGVDYFQIYRNNNDTINYVKRTEVPPTGEDPSTWQTEEIMGPGDATVPERSALLADYPALSLQLNKCRLSGGIHAEMIGDPDVQSMVRSILTLPQGEEPPGCNPQHTPFPEDRKVATETLRQFLETGGPRGHQAHEIGFQRVSGMAGEIRRLENQAPATLSRMSGDLQGHVAGLSDDELAALARALQRWGIETQALWRHAPRLGMAVQTAAEAADPLDQRDQLKAGVVDSYLHNVAQSLIQMMLYIAADSYSSQEAGRFSDNMRDLRAIAGLLDVMATNRLAVQTWREVGPLVQELSEGSAGADADARLAKLEGRLLALSGEERYESWVYRTSAAGLEVAPPPRQDRGGAERTRITVSLHGLKLQPGISDNGVDWQDIGVPRQRSSSTAYVGSPTFSEENPSRWIGTVVLELPDSRRIKGRVLGPGAEPVAGLQVRGTLADFRGSQASVTTTTGDAGNFSLELFAGYAARIYINDHNIRPASQIPAIPAGADDVDLGDIEVGARPRIREFKVTPNRPERGATVRLSAGAVHPLNAPLTYQWEQRSNRWSWDEIGEGPEVEWTAPDGPQGTSLRVRVSDGVFESASATYVTPVNTAPELLGLELEDDTGQVMAGQSLSLVASATDRDGDPLTYKWRAYPGWWTPWPASEGPEATWQAPWSPDDRTYKLSVAVTDGAVYDYSRQLEVTVRGRPDPTATLELSPARGTLPLSVTLRAQAQDPVGDIVKYDWSFQKQTAYQFFHTWESVTTEESGLTRVLEEPGLYRVRVAAYNDIDRAAESEWRKILVTADPRVKLEATALEGIAPHQVTLTATASGAGRIRTYEWDLNGDGVINRLTRSNSIEETFRQPGTHPVRVTAVGEGGLRASDTIGITVTRELVAPQVTLIANPNFGMSPLTITFTAIATDAIPGRIVGYEWDFDGDGKLDQTTLENTATLDYQGAASFTARVTALDDDGLTATDSVDITVCRVMESGSSSRPPHALVGKASIDGVPAPDGAEVVAYIGCDQVARAEVSGGEYSMVIAQPFNASYDGQLMTFTVNGIPTDQTTAWQSGEIALLNLNAIDLRE